MIKIGVSGISGSGKSTFCQFFKKDNGFVLDLDAVGHSFYCDARGPVYKEVVGEFENLVPGLLNADGSINRKALGSYVFLNEAALSSLNGIFYIRFREYVENLICELKGAGFDYFVLDAAVLFASGLDRLMDHTVWIEADPGSVISRLIEKRNGEPGYVENLVRKQIENFKQYPSLAGFRIKNSGTTEELFSKYKVFIKEIIK